MAIPANYVFLKEEDQAIARALNHLKSLPAESTAEKAFIEKFIEQESRYLETYSNLQANLDKFRLNAQKKLPVKNGADDPERLKKHDSTRLGKNLRAAGMERPAPGWQAHAIVAGTHRESATLRFILAIKKIGFDDPDNGAWLPQYASDRILAPKKLQKAIIHGATHRKSYYKHLARKYIKANLTPKDIRDNLKLIRNELQLSTISTDAIPEKSRDGKSLERWKA